MQNEAYQAIFLDCLNQRGNKMINLENAIETISELLNLLNAVSQAASFMDEGMAAVKIDHIQ